MKRIIALFLLIITILSVTACTILRVGDTVKFDKKNSLVIAHRGLSGIEIENTESAFIAAGERSYYGIEADVRRTVDGKFVICHDSTLERLSGLDIEIESCTLEELFEIELFGKIGKGKERLTDLESYISICKKYEKQAILELKSSFTDEEIGQIIDIILDLDYIEKVTFISFGYDELLCVRRLLPEQSVQYLFSEVTDEVVEMLIRDRIDAGINFTSLTKNLIDRLHAAGLKVNCWTVDIPIIAEQLASIGVDFITTNILE